MIVSIKILYNTPNTMKKMVGQTKLQMLHRNHSGGVYQAWHLSLILYHILELARALTGHYFFTVSGKDLNGKILGLHEHCSLSSEPEQIKLIAAIASVKATLWRFSMQLCHIVIRGPILVSVVCLESKLYIN